MPPSPSTANKKQPLLVQLATLKDEVELAAMRIQATEIQWVRDRQAFSQEREDLQQKLRVMTNKLIVAERRIKRQGMHINE